MTKPHSEKMQINDNWPKKKIEKIHKAIERKRKKYTSNDCPKIGEN